MAYHVKSPDPIRLDSVEVRLDLELWEDNNPVASICASLSNYNQSVNVAKRKKTQCHFRPLALWPRASGIFLVCCHLQHICNDIAMADHDTFLKTYIN